MYRLDIKNDRSARRRDSSCCFLLVYICDTIHSYNDDLTDKGVCMKLKVLITGKNRKVASDISERLEKDRGYMIVKCGPTKKAVFDIILAELPKIVIICLGDESADTVKAYDVLRDATLRGLCMVIVIANDEDERIFIKHSELSRVLFLSRPVSLFALYEKLTEIEEKIEQKRENEMSAFREYVNERTDSRFRRKQILVVDDDT